MPRAWNLGGPRPAVNVKTRGGVQGEDRIPAIAVFGHTTPVEPGLYLVTAPG